MVLSTKQQKFVNFYLGEANGNATKAALMAGFSRSQAGSYAWRLREKPAVKALIAQRLEESALKAREVLHRLSEQATASMEDFISFDAERKPFVDLNKAAERGKLHLAKQIVLRRDGSVRVELVDTQAALALLGKYHRLFTERVMLADSGPVEIRYVNDWRPSPQTATASRCPPEGEGLKTPITTAFLPFP